uniref:Uncharacterized protein n=1 Tax=Cucumis melo TaxID=3656 RepID=A0A9I9EKE9_CUCME
METSVDSFHDPVPIRLMVATVIDIYMSIVAITRFVVVLIIYKFACYILTIIALFTHMDFLQGSKLDYFNNLNSFSCVFQWNMNPPLAKLTCDSLSPVSCDYATVIFTPSTVSGKFLDSFLVVPAAHTKTLTL